MSRFYNHKLIIGLKIYASVALITAAVLSPFYLSFVPVVLLGWYIYEWRWPLSPVVKLMTQYFMFFAVALLFASSAGSVYGTLISLPLLVLLNNSLEVAAESQPVTQVASSKRRPTTLGLTMLSITIVTLWLGMWSNSLTLLLTSAFAIVYLGVIGAIVVRRLPLKPVVERLESMRTVAGKQEHINIKLTTSSRLGGLLFVKSPYDWVKVKPGIISLKGSELLVEISLASPLAGPSMLTLEGYATDRWGLIKTGFTIQPVKLNIIPRARYAANLAQQYLANTRSGTLPMVADIGKIKPLYGLRKGVEYYGNRMYQPGDSLKHIDWKHSIKYNELVIKEFAEFHGQPALVLVNLCAANAEDADKLAYNILVTALTLAWADITAALAIYNDNEVVLTTELLLPRRLVLHALQVTDRIVNVKNPSKYLDPPDVSFLRSNISRIRMVDSHPARALTELLQIEYQNLSKGSKTNPCTKALTDAWGKVNTLCTLVIVSNRNHDTEALAFNSFAFAQKGVAIITV